jgi:heme ABC exporter ATP-binding subunit CcmA
MSLNSAEGAPQGGVIIRAEKLVKAYGLLPVLRGLDLEIARGTCVALLGPNGSGKSTLMRLLSGLSRPTSGALSVGGWALPREAAAVRAHIGVIGHRPLLYDGLTARENLLFFGRLYGLPADALDARIATLLSQVGLTRRAHDLTRTFSRGMQQRLSIARALLHDPDVLLFDEPYTGLDLNAVATLDALLNQARAEGRTIVLTTHQLDQAVALADRALILARGVIGYDAPARALSTRELTDEYARLTGSVPGTPPRDISRDSR